MKTHSRAEAIAILRASVKNAAEMLEMDRNAGRSDTRLISSWARIRSEMKTSVKNWRSRLAKEPDIRTDMERAKRVLRWAERITAGDCRSYGFDPPSSVCAALALPSGMAPFVRRWLTESDYDCD